MTDKEIFNVYIGNLSYKSDEVDLEELMKPFGEVVSSRVVRDRRTLRHRTVRDPSQIEPFQFRIDPGLAHSENSRPEGKVLPNRQRRFHCIQMPGISDLLLHRRAIDSQGYPANHHIA